MKTIIAHPLYPFVSLRRIYSIIDTAGTNLLDLVNVGILTEKTGGAYICACLAQVCL